MEHGYHQTTDLYLHDCGIKRCEAKETTYHLASKEYILHIMLAGNGSLRMNDQCFTLGEGQMFLFFPDGKDYVIATEGWSSLSYMWVSFNGGKAKSIMQRIGLFSTQPVCTLPVPMKNVAEIMKKLIRADGNTLSDHIRGVGYLYRLLGVLLAPQQAACSKRASHEYSSKTYALYAKEYIKNNYSHTTITDIAGQIGIDRSYLHHVFKKYFHMPPQEFLMVCRLEAAASLLKTTRVNICQIAREVGYEDSMQFSKIFKKYYGCSPKHYRDNVIQERS